MEDILAIARDAVQPFLQVSNLRDLYHAYKTIPSNYALIGHCLFLAALAPDLKHRFLVHFWTTFLAGFGGGLLTSLLIMDRTKAPIGIFYDNQIGVTYFICWWLMVYSPFNIVDRLHSLPPVKIATKLCLTFLRANLIINRVDIATELFPGVIAAPLILGTLAGSGGKLIVDAIRHNWGGLPGPAEASVPTFVWRSAALAAGGYWAVCKYTTLLSSKEAAALVITVLLAHSILSDLFGPNVTDFTYPVAKVAHTVSLVPMPTAAAAPAASKAAKKAAASQPPAKKAQQPAPKVESLPATSSTTSAAPAKQAAEPPAQKATSGKNVAVKADSTSSSVTTKNGKKENKKTK